MLFFVLAIFCISSVAATPAPLLPGALPATFSPRNLQFPEINQGRIVGGNPAYKGLFPWQAALYLSISGDTFFCSGALIRPRWILTAAHCLEGVSEVTAFLGVVTLSDTSAVTGYASRLQAHSQYSSVTRANDVGLVQLSTSVEVSATVGLVALASSTLAEAVPVHVSGWGSVDDSGTIIGLLRYVRLTTISNNICGQTYGNLIQSTMVCAEGNSNEGPCTGDNGGPLIADLTSSPVHVGIVSFGHPNGCINGFPTVYTRTAAYIQWIASNAGA